MERLFPLSYHWEKSIIKDDDYILHNYILQCDCDS